MVSANIQHRSPLDAMDLIGHCPTPRVKPELSS